MRTIREALAKMEDVMIKNPGPLAGDVEDFEKEFPELSQEIVDVIYAFANGMESICRKMKQKQEQNK